MRPPGTRSWEPGNPGPGREGGVTAPRLGWASCRLGCGSPREGNASVGRTRGRRAERLVPSCELGLRLYTRTCCSPGRPFLPPASPPPQPPSPALRLGAGWTGRTGSPGRVETLPRGAPWGHGGRALGRAVGGPRDGGGLQPPAGGGRRSLRVSFGLEPRDVVKRGWDCGRRRVLRLLERQPWEEE